MRCLERNKQPVYFSFYCGKTSNIDDDGYRTGTYTENYSPPVMSLFNVSAAQGRSEIEQFGIDLKYSKIMVTCDMDCPINESTRLWIGVTPSKSPFNYVVVGVARSINSITYAINEVNAKDEIHTQFGC